MKTQIHAYLSFNGKCREAMTFYQECLGGKLTFQTVGGSPIEERCPTGMEDQILHSSLIKGELLLMATDMVGPAGYIVGTNISLSLSCSSEAEITEFYEKLSAGGRIVDSLKMQHWGALFGVVIDKYNIAWMLNYDKNQAY